MGCMSHLYRLIDCFVETDLYLENHFCFCACGRLSRRKANSSNLLLLPWDLFSSELSRRCSTSLKNTLDQFRSKEKFSLNINLQKDGSDADNRDTL